MPAFEELGLAPEILRAVDEMGWLLPSPIQDEAIPLILGGGDVMAAAETGSGKTGAFGIPIVQVVQETLRQRQLGGAGAGAKAKPKPSKPGAKVDANPAQGIRFSVEDRDAVFAVSPSGLDIQARAARSWSGGRATGALSGGRYYYEAQANDEGLCRVGWSTVAGSYDVGTDPHGYGFGSTGKKSNKRKFDDYGDGGYGKGDVIGCYVDFQKKEITYTKNGKDLGLAFRLPESFSSALYPAITLKNAEMTVNFGATPFAFPVKSGFKGVADALAKDFVDDSAARGGTSGSGNKKEGSGSGALALILEPTRDLAEQVYQQMTSFGKYLVDPKLHQVCLVGGYDNSRSQKDNERDFAQASIVIGTIGRVADMLKRKKLSVANIRFFVLDEADRFLDDGVLPDIMKIFKAMPSGDAGAYRLQVCFFSATLHSKEIKDLASKVCHQPTWVDLKGEGAVPETVHHLTVRVDPAKDGSWGGGGGKGAGGGSKEQMAVCAKHTDLVHKKDKVDSKGKPSPESLSEGVKRLKLHYLRRVIETLKMDQCLIFCRTNLDCDCVENYLNELGGGRKFQGKVESGKENPFSCCVVAGWRGNNERRQNLQAFKDGDVRFLICTDVAARGIDIKELPFVVNVTLPDTAENYIHRIGRVGRADCMGLAISLVSTVPEKVWFCSKPHKPPCETMELNEAANFCNGYRKHKEARKNGTCAWYDEPGLLKAVELRLKKPIAAMAPGFKLPKEMSNIKYGEEVSGVSEESSEHVKFLAPTVQQLVALEVQAQQSWLASRRFGKRAS